MVEAVKLQARKVRGHDQFTVTVPKKLLEKLNWQKGELLLVDIVEHNGRMGLFFYSAETK